MSLTFGSASAPSQVITNLDSIFATSLANYRGTLVDNIGATNAFMNKVIKGDGYESADGGTYIAEDLMYALAASDSYDGYDTLSTLPTDGITQAQFEWRQQATPISYNMKEVIQNQHRLVNLVKSRITQSEMGIQEGWAQAFMWGSAPNGGSLKTPRTSLVNGSTNIEPLPKLVSFNTTNLTVGNIAELGNTWWRNHSAASAATTYSAFIYELTNMYNLCALGTGGAPNLILMDQISYQLFNHAFFAVFKHAPGADDSFPFAAVKFFNATVVMDDKVPDAYSDLAGTAVGGVVDPTTMTYGTAYFLNTKFFKVRYAPERDFEMLKDENGKMFAKPTNGDSRLGHVAWMGNVTMNNRRKHGVLAKIARTLT